MQSTVDLVENEEKNSFFNMTNKQRLKYVAQLITVEPLLVAYLMSSIICGPALTNLEIEKACRSDLGYNDTVCDQILTSIITDYSMENDQVQELIGRMHSWQVPIQSVMPLILVLFLGSYSDRQKLRKPFMLIPIFGEFFAVAGCMLSVVFMKEWPLAVQGFAQTVLPSFFGGYTMVIMAIFAYIADVSTVEMRTLRIGIVQIVLNICTPIGQVLSGILFAKIGYYGVLSIAVICYAFAIIYGLFCIKEPKRSKSISKKSFLIDAFDPKHAIETFSLLFKQQKIRRTFLVAVLMILLLFSLAETGEGSIIYLYLQKFFAFTPLEWSYFITTNTIIHLVGTLIGVPLFTRFLHLDDLFILTITFSDKIVTNIIFGLARSITVLYVGLAASIITGISTIAIRSLATKIVSEDDLGKAQSLFGICEAIGPAIASPLYNSLYLGTLNTFPSSYFYLSIILYIIAILIVLWMYFASRQGKTEKNGVSGNGVQEQQNDDLQMTHI